MLRDGGDRHVALRRELRLGPVVVESHHRGEALARDRARVVHRDETVRVGGVADHEDAHVVGRAGGERLALRGEDRAVHLEQLLALHALRARPGADEQRVVDAVERRVGVVGLLDAGEQRERAVVELHHDTVQRGQRGRDLEQREDHRLVGAEQVAARDAEQRGCNRSDRPHRSPRRVRGPSWSLRTSLGRAEASPRPRRRPKPRRAGSRGPR